MKSNTLILYLITGVAFGYILTRSRFGFAGGIKRIYVTGEGSLTRALLIMFGITIIAMAGIQWGAAAKGAVLNSAAGAGDMIIPGLKSVKVLNLATVVGGFSFGIGMILAGGCASGTLTDLGEGAMRAAIALLFFCLDALPGRALRYVFDGSTIALLLAGRFKLDYNFNFKDVLLYSLGGLLMGFGARFAKGCNIGALYAAISNFSLHGWGFLASLTLGGIAGLKFFEGKINIIPPNRHLKEKANNK